MSKKSVGLLLLIYMMFSQDEFVYAEEVKLTGRLLESEIQIYNSDLKTTNLTLNGLNQAISYVQIDNPEWLEMEIGGQRAFIPASLVKPVEIVLTKIPTSTVRPLKAQTDFLVYSDPSTSMAIVATGKSGQAMKTLGYKNGFFKVEIAGQDGFIKRSVFTTAKLGENTLEVLQDATPIYELVNKKRYQMGTLKEGFVFKQTKQIQNWHQIEKNGRIYQIDSNFTMPSSFIAPVSGVPKSIFPGVVKTEKETIVTNSLGNVIGTIRAGKSITLINASRTNGYFDFMGLQGSVQLKDLKHSNLIQPKKNISHKEMSYWMIVFAGMYPEFTKLETIGKSVEGRDLYALKVGTGKKEILMDGSLHAREHMTTNVLMEMIDSYTGHYLNKTYSAGYNVRQILEQTSIWFVPMVNPDGVTLVQNGKNAVKNGDLASRINGSTNFARWKANVRGVDLNDNFDSGWSVISSTIKKPNYMGYRGPRVFSEPEAVALKNFVEKHNFKSYISYHSAGQVLYWFMFQQDAQLARDIQYVNQLKSITGYTVMSPLYKRGSGASTDWFIQKTKNPAVTVEIGPYTGEKPVPFVYWDRIWKQNHKVGLHAANEAWRRK